MYCYTAWLRVSEWWTLGKHHSITKQIGYSVQWNNMKRILWANY